MCSIVKSSITMRCGIWSYNQIISIPETEVQLHITSSECQAMIQEGVYRTPDGRELNIKMDVENVFKFTLNGEIHAQTDKTNFCQGKDLQVESGIIENAIILEQVKINIINTTILSETNQRLISEIDMAYLPSQCKAHHNVCYSQTGTFVWESNENHKSCHFEFYRM